MNQDSSDKEFQVSPKELGLLLRKLRAMKGITLRELSRTIGFDCGYLSRIERGKTWPSGRALAALATFYNAPELYVLAGRLMPDSMMPRNVSGLAQGLKHIQNTVSYQRIKQDNVCLTCDPYLEYVRFAPSQNTPQDIYFDERQNDWKAIFAALDIPQDFIYLPPLLRSKLIEQCAVLKQAQVQAVADRSDHSNTEKETTYANGYIDGMCQAYEMLCNLLVQHGLYWLLAAFVPPREARALAIIYDHLRLTEFADEVLVGIQAYLKAYTQFAGLNCSRGLLAQSQNTAQQE